MLEHLGTDVKVTVTASPRKGLEATLDLTERLARAGYAVVPHLSARLVRDRAHLEEIVARLLAAGVRELFVLAGDATSRASSPAPPSCSSAMGPLRAQFDEIGITGYPESHHLISDEETIQAMFAKAPMATCIISQICFDAEVIAAWIAEVRRARDAPADLDRPARASVDYARLVRISMKIGLGESARFLGHHRNWMSRLMTRQFKPDPLLRGTRPDARGPGRDVAGFHLYTFNEVARTERWRRQALERLGRSLKRDSPRSGFVQRLRDQRRDVDDAQSSPRARTPSSSITVQNGQATASVSAPVSAASRARSSLISPPRSSIHMCAPPAPQQNVRLPLRSISTGAPTAATSSRGSLRTSLWRAR